MTDIICTTCGAVYVNCFQAYHVDNMKGKELMNSRTVHSHPGKTCAQITEEFKKTMEVV